MALTNDTLHTASLTNDPIMVQTKLITFEQTRPATFGEMQGTFGVPWSIKNDTLHTASMTNDTIH